MKWTKEILGTALGTLLATLIIYYFSTRPKEPSESNILQEKSVHGSVTPQGLRDSKDVRDVEFPKNTDKKIPSQNNDVSEGNRIVDEAIQQNTIIESDAASDNEVQHKGSLCIRVLNNKQPISFIGSYVSCAKNSQPDIYDNAVFAKDISIADNNRSAWINVKVNNQRWLLDMFQPELKMSNCDIEINGKIIPDKYIEEMKNGESANYKIRLKRIE